MYSFISLLSGIIDFSKDRGVPTGGIRGLRDKKRRVFGSVQQKRTTHSVSNIVFYNTVRIESLARSRCVCVAPRRRDQTRDSGLDSREAFARREDTPMHSRAHARAHTLHRRTHNVNAYVRACVYGIYIPRDRGTAVHTENNKDARAE